VAQVEVSDDFLKAAAAFNVALQQMVGGQLKQEQPTEDPRPVLKAMMKVHVLLKDPDSTYDDDVPMGFKDPRVLFTAHAQILAQILSDGGLWRFLDERGLERNWIPMTRIKDITFTLVLPEMPSVGIADPAMIKKLTKQRVTKDDLRDPLKQPTPQESGLHIV